MKTICFHSMVGGIGRTTCLANCALLLAEKHKVLILDFEFTKVGLALNGLMFKNPPHIQNDKACGFSKIIMSKSRTASIPEEVHKFDKFPLNLKGQCDLLPLYAAPISCGDLLRMRFSLPELFSHFVLSSIRAIEELGYDYVFIDVPVGISDMTGFLGDKFDTVVLFERCGEHDALLTSIWTWPLFDPDKTRKAIRVISQTNRNPAPKKEDALCMPFANTVPNDPFLGFKVHNSKLGKFYRQLIQSFS